MEFEYFWKGCLIVFLTCLIGSGLGLIIGSFSKDIKMSTAYIPFFVQPMVFFSGLMKNRADYPSWIGWIEYFSPLKYSFNALTMKQFGDDNPLVSYLNY